MTQKLHFTRLDDEQELIAVFNNNPQLQSVEIGEVNDGHGKTGLFKTYQRGLEKPAYLAQEAFFMRDQEDGLALAWTENGALADVSFYQKGELVADYSANLKAMVLNDHAKQLTSITRDVVKEQMIKMAGIKPKGI